LADEGQLVKVSLTVLIYTRHDRLNVYQAKPPECVPGVIARIYTRHDRLNMYQA
jgi:hypothetical protein